MAQIRIDAANAPCRLLLALAYVVRNVFSRARKTDTDMSTCPVEVQLVDQLFHIVGPLTAKLLTLSQHRSLHITQSVLLKSAPSATWFRKCSVKWPHCAMSALVTTVFALHFYHAILRRAQ